MVGTWKQVMAFGGFGAELVKHAKMRKKMERWGFDDFGFWFCCAAVMESADTRFWLMYCIRSRH